MADLTAADPIAVVVAWLKQHPTIAAEFGGDAHVSGLNEAPFPHVEVAAGPGGDLRDLDSLIAHEKGVRRGRQALLVDEQHTGHGRERTGHLADWRAGTGEDHGSGHRASPPSIGCARPTVTTRHYRAVMPVDGRAMAGVGYARWGERRRPLGIPQPGISQRLCCTYERVRGLA